MKSQDFEIAVEEMMALFNLPRAERDKYVQRAIELNHIEFKRNLKRAAKAKSVDAKW